MDEFDIIDLVYRHVEDAGTGFDISKDRSETDMKENHIVINHLEFQEFDYENVLPVNVNIFVKLHKNGMPNRELMRDAKRKVRAELMKIKTENGQYRNSEIEGSLRLIGAKENFDCINIKVIIKTDK